MTKPKTPKSRQLPLLNGQLCPECGAIGWSDGTRYVNNYGKPLKIPTRRFGCDACGNRWKVPLDPSEIMANVATTE